MATADLFLTLNLKDPAHATLVGLAGRLDVPLNKPKVRSDQNVAGTFDEFLGGQALTTGEIGRGCSPLFHPSGLQVGSLSLPPSCRRMRRRWLSAPAAASAPTKLLP
jgi:hypothetical protein